MHGRKTKSLYDLPPTSLSLQIHLERCLYVTNIGLKKLSINNCLDPIQCSWINNESRLFPNKSKVTFANDYTITCGCNKRCTGQFRHSKKIFLILSSSNALTNNVKTQR